MSGTYSGNDAFPTSITIPSDGDARAASSVNAALEALADRTVYLKSNGFLDIWQNANNDDASAEQFTTTSYVDSTAIVLTVDDCKTNDVIDIVCTTSTNQTGTPGDSWFQIFAVDNYNGTPTANIEVLGAGQKLLDASGSIRTVALSGMHVVTEDGDCRVKLAGKIQTAGGSNALNVYQKFHIGARRWRPLP